MSLRAIFLSFDIRRAPLRAIALGLVLSVAVVWAVIGIFLRDDAVRHRIVTALSEQLNADVTLESLRVDIFPTVRIVGAGLRIHRRQDPYHVPSMIVAEKFQVVPGMWHVLRGRARLVEVDGFRFTVPRPDDEGFKTEPDVPDPDDAPDTDSEEDLPPWVISQVVALNAELVHTPRDLIGPIRAFPIHRLELREVGFNRPMAYDARLTNPQPKGEFHARGTFGPLRPDDPGASPLKGRYVLSGADFNTIRGLSGTVNSEADFTGALAQLNVNGSSNTPNFRLDAGGQPVNLSTEFLARLDCTSGDLYLSEVKGQLSKSAFTASGSITGAPGLEGRRVDLNFTMDNGRAEDVFRLVVSEGEPLMVGRMALATHFVLPHGEGRPVLRMQVSGQVRIADAYLGSKPAQARVEDISRRALGQKDKKPRADAAPTRLSVAGKFGLTKGTVRVGELQFSAPGIAVTLTGSYRVPAGTLDLRGSARLHASLRHQADGLKGALLTLVSPLFKKDGAGAVVPIRVSGTHAAPRIGLDLGRIFGGG